MNGEGCGVSGVITARWDGGGEELAPVAVSAVDRRPGDARATRHRVDVHGGRAELAERRGRGVEDPLVDLRRSRTASTRPLLRHDSPSVGIFDTLTVA